MEEKEKISRPTRTQLLKRALCNVIAITAVVAIFAAKAMETPYEPQTPLVAAVAETLP